MKKANCKDTATSVHETVNIWTTTDNGFISFVAVMGMILFLMFLALYNI